MSAAEFLSKIKKSERLHPIVSIVLYYGEEPWDGPFSLRDMIADMPQEIAAVFSDYRMNLMQVRESGGYRFGNEDVRTVFEISAYILKGRLDEIEKQYKNRDIKKELAAMSGAITNSEKLVQQAAGEEGETMSMCTALENLEKRGMERGIEQGKRELIQVMLKNGCSYEEVSRLTDIPIEKLKQSAEGFGREAH